MSAIPDGANDVTPIVTPVPPPDLMTKYLWSVEDIVQFFGVSRFTVYRWNRGDGPQRSKCGKRVYYKRDDVLAWFKDREVQ